MIDTCHRIKAKDCEGVFPKDAQPEDWLYWCKKPCKWQLQPCHCEGPKYQLIYNKEDPNFDPSHGKLEIDNW